MKKVFSAFMVAATILSVTAISSCTKTCDPGFEGDDCKTEIRAKFLKNNATVADNCTNTGYSLTISEKQSNVEYVVFSNLGNFGTPAVVEAQASGNTLSATSFTDAAGRKFTLSGTLTGSILTVSYTVVYTDNTSETCVATISL